MKSNTDLAAVKSTALSFLYLDVEPTKLAPVVVMHPIFENGIVFLKGENAPGNILEDEEVLEKARQIVREEINDAKDAMQVYGIIRKSYRLTFFKHVAEYLSINDYSKLLADAWTMSENPNQDVNVSTAAAVRFFKKADKQMLMDEDEFIVYCDLPETFEVYRGVSVGRNPNGLSWTRNKETASWFAHRFDKKDKCGYVQVALAEKKDVLAYFNSRGEDELVISPKSLKEIKRIEL